MWPTRSGYLSLLVLSKWEDRAVGQSLKPHLQVFSTSWQVFHFSVSADFPFLYCTELFWCPQALLTAEKSPPLEGVLLPLELLVTAWRPAIKAQIARICLHMVTSFSSSRIILPSTPASCIHLNLARDGHSLWFHQVLPGYPPFRQFLQRPFPGPASALLGPVAPTCAMLKRVGIPRLYTWWYHGICAWVLVRIFERLLLRNFKYL